MNQTNHQHIVTFPWGIAVCVDTTTRQGDGVGIHRIHADLRVDLERRAGALLYKSPNILPETLLFITNDAWSGPPHCAIGGWEHCLPALFFP